MKYELTVIVPVFNEAANMERLERELIDFLSISTKKAKVLFVDDGSKDQSLAMIENICDNNPDFHFISFQKNAGLSAALKAGFVYADTELIGYIDADLQTAPADFNLLIRELGDHALVTGVRSMRKDSFVKNASSTIANKIRRAFTNDGIDDTGCPLKIIRTEYAKQIPMFKGLHRFLPAMILLQGGSIRQVPVRHFPRVAGKSNFGLSNRLLGPLMDCFAYLWMKKKYISYKIEKSK